MSIKDENERSFSDSMNDYEFKREIGFGSFGRVFEALCVANGEMCAIKVIDVRSKRENLNRIKNEVALHLRLNHQNVVQLYTVIEDENSVYLILELCWGSLNDFIKLTFDYNNSLLRVRSEFANTNTRLNDYNSDKLKVFSKSISNHNDSTKPAKRLLSFATIRCIIKQICNGLSYLHRNNIIHRDLNLKNVLLKMNPFEQNIMVKIADFGLAFDMNSQTKFDLNASPITPQGKTICGTPGYISPEVWSQSGVSKASDVFSIGSILFALVTGFTPKGELDLNGMNPVLADVISKLLCNDPAKRLKIENLLLHPFIVGHLAASHLPPFRKLTNSLQLEVTEKETVKINFIKSNSSIEVSSKEDRIVICSKNKSFLHFTMENLPENHWKKYMYVWRFVELIKSRTPRVILHLNSNNIVSYKNFSMTVLKCCLMENNSFEANLVNNVTKENFVLNSQTLKNDFESEIIQSLKNYQTKCLEIEESMKKLENSEFRVFPVILGRKAKTKKIERNHSLDLSVTIDGIGSVTLLPDGIFKVEFKDGSSIVTGENSPIIFQSNVGTKQSFTAKDVLPKYVLKKLSLVPKAIEELRKQSILSERS
ncbi:serine/threonine-protein kinase PLK4-like protein [Dinothrombium tinctorium]|uniref:Serine/threonine-protein kinase PLK4-like protein n=1 Tax=Dinothrombium tinctorium TaxID=1965070 RepID=A0A3S3P1R5_9ACAR|nr:serine/threonine-protein kinase PLK4-like protein [Dinothrombium tinctorium]RWS05089.1 serine/threonine-protein kinase PLK4-like protein [Dinothrombium tinctorium]RWS06201.1 serine/threonine-protein kinase PLK4-like protein [Dinothrombium tinctorium]